MSFAQIMLFFTYLANWQIILSASAMIAALLALLNERRKFLFFTFAMLAGEVVYQSLKWIFHRTRPNEALALIPSDGYSFPSGHATMSVIFYGLIAYFLVSFVFRRRLWKMLSLFAFFLLIFLIGFSRIYLGVHWTSDIIGGWFLGFSILLFALALFRRREKMFPQPPAAPFVSRKIALATAIFLAVIEISFFIWFYFVHPLLAKAGLLY